MVDLCITVDDVVLEAHWLDDNPDLRTVLDDALPLAGLARRWGDECYMNIPVYEAAETTALEVEPGTIAYWPTGPAICLFWGPTPASTDDTPVAASPVAPVARVAFTDPLETIANDPTLKIERA